MATRIQVFVANSGSDDVTVYDPRLGEVTATIGVGHAPEQKRLLWWIAVGTVPAPSPKVPVDGDMIITSDDIVQLKRLPKKMVVVGGGLFSEC